MSNRDKTVCEFLFELPYQWNPVSITTIKNNNNNSSISNSNNNNNNNNNMIDYSKTLLSQIDKMPTDVLLNYKFTVLLLLLMLWYSYYYVVVLLYIHIYIYIYMLFKLV